MRVVFNEEKETINVDDLTKDMIILFETPAKIVYLLCDIGLEFKEYRYVNLFTRVIPLGNTYKTIQEAVNGADKNYTCSFYAFQDLKEFVQWLNNKLERE